MTVNFGTSNLVLFGNNDGYITSFPPRRTNLGPLNPSDTEDTTITATGLQA